MENLLNPKCGRKSYFKWLTLFILSVFTNLAFAQSPPVWQSSITNTGDAGLSPQYPATIGKPDGLSVGDLMVVALMVEKGSAVSSTAPSGWTLIRSTDASTNFGMRSYWKIATASDVAATEFSFPLGLSGKYTISNSRITGFDPSLPVDISLGQASVNNGSGETTAPSIATTANNALVLAFFGIKKGVTEPTSITNATKRHFRSGNDVTNLLGTFVQTIAGETGNRSVTFSSSEWRVGQQIAIKSQPVTQPVSCTAPVITNPGPLAGCDEVTLPAIAGTNLNAPKYYNNSQANSGTEITNLTLFSSQTVWIYDSNGNCSNEISFAVTVTKTPVITNPGPLVACDEVILPVITGTYLNNPKYFNGSQTNGGTEITNQTLTSNQTVWIYDANGNCANEISFEVTVNPTPVLVINSPGTACFPNTVDLTDPSVTSGSTLYDGELSYWLNENATLALDNPDAVNTPGTYYIKALTDAGCFDIAPVIVRFIYAPEWVSSQTNVGPGGTNPVVNKPTGIQEGDLLIVGLMVEKGTGTTITAPTGWHLILRTNRTTDAGMATYYKVATNNEPNSYTFKLTNSPKWAIGISRVTGADPTNPIAVASGANGGQVANTVAPSINTEACNTLVMAFYSNKKDATFSTPAGTTERYDHPNKKDGQPSNMLATYIQSVAGATGTKTSTASEKENWVAQQIGIRAATPVNQNNLRVMTPQPEGSSVETVSRVSETISDSPDGKITDSKLYPMPSQGVFTIELPWIAARDVQVNVYNLNGIPVFNQSYGETGNTIQVDLSSNVSGMYLVKIQVEGQTVVRKLFIQK